MLCSKCVCLVNKYGFNSNNIQRYRCPICLKIYLAPHSKLFDNMKIPTKKGLSVLHGLLEGLSIRSTERITGIHRDTILDLLVIAGKKCQVLFDKYISRVPVKDVQADEIWCFVFCKERTKNLNYKNVEEFGDAYTFVAMERTTKLILAWHLGKRTTEDTEIFTEKLEKATTGNFQITTDGFSPYRDAISYSLGTRVSFAQIIKEFKGNKTPERKYSPSKITKIGIYTVIGNPNRKLICTSHIERQNLTMRMQIRRFTRLTNAFSKKWENLHAALALYFAYYNFCRIHSTIRCTPAMESRITNHIWKIEDLLK
jgi:IS1 family transposase